VNIHPTKQEIKFVDNSKVLDNINKIVKNNLMPRSYRASMRLEKPSKTSDNDLPKIFEQMKSEESNKGLNNVQIHDFTEGDYNFIDDLSKYQLNNNHKLNKLDKSKSHTEEYSIDKYNENDEEIQSPSIRNDIFDINPIGRVLDTYIVAEMPTEEKVLFIDQHAAHERIMYEKYKKEYKNEKIITQQLLAPEVINLTNKEMDELNRNIQVFKDLGFDIEEFGPNSIAIRGVPMLFGIPMFKNLFIDILDGLNMGIKSSYDTRIDKIMK